MAGSTSHGTTSKDPTQSEDLNKLILQKLDCLPKIQTTIDKIDATLVDLKTSLQYTQDEVDDLKQTVEQHEVTIDSQGHKIEALDTKINLLMMQNKHLKDNLVSLEAYGRRENLIFDNIEESHTEGDCKTVLVNFLKNKLKITEQIPEFSRVHRLGSTHTKTTKPRPIIARFAYYPDRVKIWNKRFELKGTSFLIREDFPVEINRERRALYPVFKAARAKGIKASLNGNRLIIDGKQYSNQNIHELNSKLNLQGTSEKVDDKMHLFAGRYSPLSNFHHAIFTIGDEQFSCTEQYYQYRKAIHANDKLQAAKIKTATDPLDIKYMGDSLKVNNKIWLSTEAIPAMQLGLAAKFDQNKHLAQTLMATGNKRLVEATSDKFWGSGVPVWHSDATDVKSWNGDNRLGTCLEDIRKNLRP